MQSGEVAEWSKAPHSKCGVPERVPWVQIPPSPLCICIFFLEVATLAQLVEQCFRKAKVPGSNPGGGSQKQNTLLFLGWPRADAKAQKEKGILFFSYLGKGLIELLRSHGC
jgi:hypothetical protein